MKTIEEIRRENARKLRDGVGGNSNFAAMLDREATQISRVIGKNPTKKIGDDLARHMEICFSLATGWLDKTHDAAAGHTNIQETSYGNDKKIKLVPVISWVQAGAWTEIAFSEVDLIQTEHYPCPVACGERTYILRVVGDSMSPEYSPGDLIFVDPDVTPWNGDDVIALMSDFGETTFKRFIEEGSERMLKALNPDWPERYIPINSNCHIIGTVIFSGKSRRHR
ncbi:S24 family peptidase [Serratia marcescens]|jgi:SOS-response transcriptional repressor LexA|uniref:LexA family protein n=1 Tax=Serratia TaxID=613 RepID=UPI000C19251D|nr:MULTISPECIES: S24 family peptidase [Serratia]MBH2769232.1 LexA family transcriptional repressor [Serratia marcescens]MBI6125258.1 LexA family transcriptional repressor [Serratia marcescens]NMT26809.1 LexA family transcriptional repressor [Serratia marcescens]PIJ10638.1 LexA family transcriptional repressor [Serratia sp. OMLW3]PIJ13250.1 LexA family transcriptional repressor [Serratia sp. OLAL2]